MRILVTGMSGTGKSSALAELERRGFHVVDTDEPGWCVWSDDDGGWLWVEERIASLLDGAQKEEALFVSGCVSNQRRFYDRFDAVVLLSAAPEVVLDRVARRTTNDYGKSAAERAEILDHLGSVEPRLRATASHEIDASKPLLAVVDELEAIAAGAQRTG